MSLKEIKKIATQVRSQAEKISLHPDLSEMCGICSYWIFRQCQKKGIRGVRFATNDEHAFILYKDHIIDVTATQFGVSEKIVVKNILNKTDQPPCYWHIHRIYDNLRSIRNEFKYWPEEQRPYALRSLAKQQ